MNELQIMMERAQALQARTQNIPLSLTDDEFNARVQALDATLEEKQLLLIEREDFIEMQRMGS